MKLKTNFKEDAKFALSRSTFDKLFQKCEDELRHYCGELYSMGNDRQEAEDYCYKVSSFIDYMIDEKEVVIAENREVEFLNLCFRNEHLAKAVHKACKDLDFADKNFDSVYG